MAQLAKSEADEREAKNSLESLQSEKEDKESGARNPDNMEWVRNIKLINKNNEAYLANVTFAKYLILVARKVSHAP